MFNDDDVAKVARAYIEWRMVGGQYADVAGFCKVAPVDEVRKQDYKLTPGIYVGTEDQEEAIREITEYIELFYNTRRRHGYNEGLSPVQYEKQTMKRLGSV